jgi:hypothetical protein
MFDAKQEKLLVLAMDPSALPGEAANVATAFFRSLKSKYSSGHELLVAIKTAAGRVRTSAHGADYSLVTLPYGRFKGCQLKSVPLDYLLWALNERDYFTEPMREAIKRFLRDSDFYEHK